MTADSMPCLEASPDNILMELIQSLGADEREVIRIIAERLHKGSIQYGTLDVDTDRRDWSREKYEELADAAVYAAIGALQRARAA